VSDVDFVSHIVKSLTGKDDCFEISRSVDERGVLLELTVDKEYCGRVIGKGGENSKAIRTLLHTLGVQNDARYSLKVEIRE
jgi:hypothetical protein